MAVYNELPKVSLKAEDIRDSLNSYGGSVSNDTLTFFTTGANINPWSRAKPIHIYQVIEPDRSTEWYKGTDGKCGFNTDDATATSYTAIASKYTDDKWNGWKYVLPSGGANSPYRLGDFGGYKADAVQPIEEFSVASQVVKGDNIVCMCAHNITEVDKTIPGSLHIDEIGGFDVSGTKKSIADLYFGAVVMQNGSAKAYITNTTKGVLECSVPSSSLAVGDYEVYPFLCTVIQNGTTAAAGNYFTLPNVGKASLKIITTNYTMNIVASYVYTNGVRTGVSVTATVKNGTSSSKTFSNNYLYMKLLGNDLSTNLDTANGEAMKTLSTVTIAAGATVTVANTSFTIETANATKSYAIWLNLGSGAEIGMAHIEDDMSSPILPMTE